MTAAAPDLDDAGLAKVRRMVLRLLYESRTFARAHTWSRACVRIRPEGNDVVSRARFAHELLADDSRAAAHECMRRTVRPGEVLAFVLQDDQQNACAHFVVLRLLEGAQR